MDIKKILALAIVVLAVFSCMSVVSAGLFDFLGGGVNNATYTFDGFTLDLPENANFTNDTNTDNGFEEKVYDIEWTEESGKNVSISVTTAKGDSLVSDVNEFIDNWVSDGAKSEGTYKDWNIININGVKVQLFEDLDLNFTFSGYILTKHTGSELITIEGDDLAVLKSVADTYKEI
ncbi:hypothetical protein [Methanobrevibacter sp.]|uniref:hypothetical protein n=1 Tax=Methanobrevibacter sp. TaxID=66852 RepID=UPI0038656E15